MKRSILLSLLVIGVAGAILAAGTLAQFTTSGGDSGTLKAASLSLDVEGTGNSLAFSGSGGNCPSALLPGDVCSDTVTVTNTSNIDLEITSVTASDFGPLNSCGDGDSLSTTTSPNIVGTVLTPGASTDFTIETTFEASADDTCQGQSGTVNVIVGAEQA